MFFKNNIVTFDQLRHIANCCCLMKMVGFTIELLFRFETSNSFFDTIKDKKATKKTEACFKRIFSNIKVFVLMCNVLELACLILLRSNTNFYLKN